MRRLAKEAGVSQATPYNLFGSKRQLLQALYMEHIDRLGAVMLRHAGTDPLEHVFEAVDHMADEIIAYPSFYRELFGVLYRTDGREEADRWWIDPSIRFWQRLFEEAFAAGRLRPGAAAAPFARNFFRLLLGAIIEWLEGLIDADEWRHAAHSAFAHWALAIAPDDALATLRARLAASEAFLLDRSRHDAVKGAAKA